MAPPATQPTYESSRASRVDHRRPARTEVIVGVTLWRLVIVLFAVIGLMAGIEENGDDALKALSQSASLLAAIVYGALLLYPLVTGMRWHEPKSAWWRGATTVTLLLVAGVFLTMLSGDVSETWSLFEHLLTPLVLLVDFMSYFPGFVAGLIVAGYLLFLTGRIKASVSAQQAALKHQQAYADGPPPAPYQQSYS